MPHTESEATDITLPLLPATNGVVLPGMVVTIAAESDEAKRAFEAADGGPSGREPQPSGGGGPSGREPQASGGELVVVPRTEHGSATVGTVARVEQLGSLPNGIERGGRARHPPGPRRPGLAR